MAFRDFTLTELKKKFSLTVIEGVNLFATVGQVALPPGLADTLRRYLPLALKLNTEKARSELLIAPMLVDLKLLHPDLISVFSGIDFNVDPSAGLNGRCDFILSRNPQQLELTAPAFVLVEAKHENIIAGVPQCLAEMVAAQRFNRAEGVEVDRVHGVVTTGLLWRFLTLEGTTARVDDIEYTMQQSEKIFGILTHIALGGAA